MPDIIIEPAEIEKKAKEKADAQAKDAILKFLTELSIDKIVYVDDRCSIVELKEAFIGKLKKMYSSKPEEIDFVNWESPQVIFEKEIITLWEESDENLKRELFLKVLKNENDADDIENSIAPLNLKKHLKEKIQLLSPSEWVSQKNDILASLNTNSKILFLFDIEFKHAPLADGRDGRDLTLELLSISSIKDLIYCGIFSHLFNIEQENDRRNEYCVSHRLAKEKFYTISKKRFQDDSYLPGLAEGIRNTLLINAVEVLKAESSKIIRKSYKNSLIQIQELNPESFNHIIQKSSSIEGIWEMATLIRINNIIVNHEALNSLLPKPKRKIINLSLSKIRQIEKIKTGGLTPFDKAQIKSLREKEVYIKSDILNQLHFPISNGDIFLINNKRYILLGQPCNLALRSNGKRDIGRNKIYNTGFLLELEEISRETLNKLKGGQLFTIGIIENNDPSSLNCEIVRFQSFNTISLSPLDLTVYNEDGRAIFYSDKTENNSKTIQESWKERYKNLHAEFVNYRNNIIMYRKLRANDKENLKKSIYYGDIFKGYEINNENVLNSSSNKIAFDIGRISHYKEPYSSDLLQKFMQYLSRNAFGHDFSN
jgi:hypothetical protein